MAIKATKHTFLRGMITDKSNLIKSPDSYDYAENLRHTSNSEDSLGNLTNLEGFDSFSTVGVIADNLVIVAKALVRDKLYILCTKRSGTSVNDAIYRYDVSFKDKEISNLTTLYFGGGLGLDFSKNTDIVSIYESDSIIKLYWVTEGQQLKVANVATYLTSDGLVKSGSNTWVDPDRFNMITSIEYNPLNFSGTTSGTLETGKIQYAYSLYKENLQETLISPLSYFVDLFQDKETESSVNTKGDYTSVNTNKGVKFNLTLSSSDVSYFDYIRLYRIHYKEYNQLPTISIVNDFPVLTDTTYTIKDTGEAVLGEITPEIFNSLSIPYNGKTVALKDNRLFMANIIENTFDVTGFDTRAYRFFRPYKNGISGITVNTGVPVGYYEISFNSYIYLNVGEKVRVTFGGLPVGGIEVTVTSVITYGVKYRFLISELSGSGVTMSDGLAVLTILNTSKIKSDLYEEYGVYTTPQYTIYGDTLSYPSLPSTEEYNCINPYNDIDEDLDHTRFYQFQSDGATYGGEGPEIKYTFITPGFSLDNNSTYTEVESYKSGYDFSHNSMIYYYTGYQRDEIYRIGVVFYNSLGQKSKVKWIGDIRFPTHNEFNNYRSIAYDNGADITAYSIGLNVTLKNGLPSGATSWELVRALRTKNDRSVITSGYISFSASSWNTTTLKGSSYKFPYPLFDTTNITTGAGTAVDYNLISFISPEEIIQGYSDIEDGDYLDVAGDMTSLITYTSAGGTYPDSLSDKNSIKFRNVEFFVDFADRERYNISDVSFFKAQQWTSTNEAYVYPIDNAYSGKYALKSQANPNIQIGGISFSNPCYHGACSVISTATNVLTTPFSSTHLDHELPYVIIKRNNINRYGGGTYLDRENTEYISCGTISSSTDHVIFGGDTYINFFDYIHSVYAYLVSTASNMVTVLFPVESTINLSLRSDFHPAKTYGISTSYLTQEVAGDYTETGGDNYNQELDLYLYNSVYSQDSNITKQYALNNLDLETSFDSRIIYSDKKINNELVDSWLKFDVNNALDVNSSYGSIQAIRNFNNDIYFWQENAFGKTPVNERSLINDNNPGALSLGYGSVLSRYLYHSKIHGCKDMLSIVDTDNVLYWIDRNKKTIISFSDQVKDLAKEKGFKSITKELIDSTTTPTNFTFSSVINPDYNELLFKLSYTNQLIYNSLLGCLSSVLTSSSEYTLNAGNLVLSHSVNKLYGHDKTTTYNNLLSGGALSKKSSILRISDTSEYDKTKVYDNITFFSNTKSSGLVLPLDTFNTVSFWNDYQYTGVITLTNNSTIRKSERGFSLDIPRNIVTNNGLVDSIDIFSASNHNVSRTFKERMRDKYITANFIYDTTNTGKLYVPYIQFVYRTSKR